MFQPQSHLALRVVERFLSEDQSIEGEGWPRAVA
jgi:hypothetical protein